MTTAWKLLFSPVPLNNIFVLVRFALSGSADLVQKYRRPGFLFQSFQQGYKEKKCITKWNSRLHLALGLLLTASVSILLNQLYSYWILYWQALLHCLFNQILPFQIVVFMFRIPLFQFSCKVLLIYTLCMNWITSVAVNTSQIWRRVNDMLSAYVTECCKVLHPNYLLTWACCCFNISFTA